MKKSDLKAGYVLIDERNRLWLVLATKDELSAQLIENGKFKSWTIDITYALNEDLTSKNNGLNPSCDVIKVYGLPSIINDYLTLEDRKLIWEREKELKVGDHVKITGTSGFHNLKVGSIGKIVKLRSSQGNYWVESIHVNEKWILGQYISPKDLEYTTEPLTVLTKEMTVAEISEKLGYNVKVVK